jgi:hypothetical protein
VAAYNGSAANVGVIDPTSGKLLKVLNTYLNALFISSDSLGNVYVQSQYDATQQIDFNMISPGEYIPPGLTVISSTTDKVVYQAPSQTSGLAPVLVSGDSGTFSGDGTVYVFQNQHLIFRFQTGISIVKMVRQP